MIMQAVGVAEDNIFKKRKEDDVRFDLCSFRIWAFKDTKSLRNKTQNFLIQTEMLL